MTKKEYKNIMRRIDKRLDYDFHVDLQTCYELLFDIRIVLKSYIGKEKRNEGI